MSKSVSVLALIRLGRALDLTCSVDDEGLREPMQPRLAWI